MILPAIKQCSKCNKIKTIDLFYGRSRIQESKKVGIRPECKSCWNIRSRQWAEDHPLEARNYYIKSNKKRYGLTVDQYNEMHEKQSGVCAICGEPDTVKLSVDHNHSCCPNKVKSCGRCVRELLCGNCNRGLGLFKENLKTLQSAIDYLERWQ